MERFSVIIAFALACSASARVKQPHIVMVLVDDWGWNDAGHHRDPTEEPKGEILTPNVVQLVKEGIELDRHYVYHYCSPSRSSLQSGRLPVHVVWMNDDPIQVNPEDPVGGFSGIPRNMTGIATRMKEAGYRTHATGKWDAGMATWDHTPMGRGYETWFGYYHHANDYYTQQVTRSNSLSGGCSGLVDLWNTTGPARDRNGTDYEENMFTQNTLNVLNHHDPSEPLFLFHSFHTIHTPFEVPIEWENKFHFLKDIYRRRYAAMVAYMDDALGQIVAKIKQKGMWEDTLMVVSSDNGGPTYWLGPKAGGAPDAPAGYGGANNRPLKGGKMFDWEGGVRVNAFVTGGAVPLTRRGTVLTDYIHISDWYATFCAIAGVDPFDTRAAKAKLPPVDGIDQSSLLLGEDIPGTGNRSEIHLSVRALIQDHWKLITGGYTDFKKFPMGVGRIGCSSYGRGWGLEAVKCSLASFINCENGCLYDIFADPSEKSDVADANPAVLKKLKARLHELNEQVYLPDRGHNNLTACSAWNGFFGPFIDMPSPRVTTETLPIVV